MVPLGLLVITALLVLCVYCCCHKKEWDTALARYYVQLEKQAAKDKAAAEAQAVKDEATAIAALGLDYQIHQVLCHVYG